MRATLACAARAGRRDPWRILAVALAVSCVTTLAELIVDHYVDPDNAVLLGVTAFTAAAISLLGTVFLAGFLCRLVGAAEHGGRRLTIGQVGRTMPWRRLVLADVIVVVIVVTGLALLVIPGLIAATLLANVGPVIEIEDRGVLAAVRRSLHLARPHFWAVALLVTVPLAVGTEIEDVIPELSGLAEIVRAFLVRGVLEGLVEAATGLILVEVCYRLIGLDGHRAGGGARSGPAVSPARERVKRADPPAGAA